MEKQNQFNQIFTELTSPSTEKYGSYYQIVAALSDLGMINLSGYLAYLFIFWKHIPEDGSFLKIGQILLVNFLWFNVTQITRLYRDIFAKDAVPTVKQSFASYILFVLFMAGLVWYVPEFKICYRLIVWMLLIFGPLFLIGKIVFLLIRRSHRERLIEYTRVVIVGAGPVGQELCRIMQSKMSTGYRVAGFFDDQADLDGPGGTRIIGPVSECMEYVRRFKIKEIFCALPDRAVNEIHALMRQADKEMIRFKLVPDVKDYFKKNVNVQMLGHFPVISARTEPLEVISNKVLKRLFDVVFSLLVIIFVLSWLLPLIGLLIKLESRGPILFRQFRSGKENKPFYCLKFRSMRQSNDANHKQASRDDHRITRLGAFLRRTSLDELPQFFNVLVGDMSVVGPRPHMLRHTKQYSALIDAFMVRHFLKPGITGWAQVNGHRGETQNRGDMEARVQHDIWYLENWSMFLDLKIVFLTVWQVFAGDEKAY